MRRHILVAVILALVAGIGVATPPFDVLRGLSLDVLTGLRWQIFGNERPPDASPVVVVALDEETYQAFRQRVFEIEKVEFKGRRASEVAQGKVDPGWLAAEVSVLALKLDF